MNFREIIAIFVKSNLKPKFISSYFVDKNVQKITTKPTQKHTQHTKEPTETYRKLPFVVMEHVQKNLCLMLKLKFSVLLDVCCSC